MTDPFPAGYIPLGWTASQFFLNVIIILGLLGLVAALRRVGR